MRMLRRVLCPQQSDEIVAGVADAAGVECRADFRRVMPVIVDNRDVVHDALDVEAAANAGEFCKALANQVGGNGEIEGHGSGGGGVAYVVHPGGMGQAEDAQIIAFISKSEVAL